MLSPSDALNAHANTLSEQGVSGTAAASSADLALAALMVLAEQARMALSPIQPSEGFVNALGHELCQAVAAPVAEIILPRRPSWVVVGVTAVGSALSVLGVLCLLRTGRILRKIS